MDSKSLVHRFYHHIWNQQDLSKIAQLCSPNFSFRGSLGQAARGYAQFAAYVDRVTAALGDYRCDIEEMIAEGDKAFARMRFSGIHRAELLGYPPIQKRVQWEGAALFTFVGDKISDLWVLGDIDRLVRQLSGADEA